jgi:hypothetical protein
MNIGVRQAVQGTIVAALVVLSGGVARAHTFELISMSVQSDAQVYPQYADKCSTGHNESYNLTTWTAAAIWSGIWANYTIPLPIPPLPPGIVPSCVGQGTYGLTVDWLVEWVPDPGDPLDVPDLGIEYVVQIDQRKREKVTALAGGPTSTAHTHLRPFFWGAWIEASAAYPTPSNVQNPVKPFYQRATNPSFGTVTFIWYPIPGKWLGHVISLPSASIEWTGGYGLTQSQVGGTWTGDYETRLIRIFDVDVMPRFPL